MTHEGRHFPKERDSHRRRQFRELFCGRFHCPISDYNERAFRKLLYWHAKSLASVLRLLMPDFFSEDFKFIETLGAAVDLRKASVDAAIFHDANTFERGALRTALRFRVSGRRALWLAHELFASSMEMTDAYRDAATPTGNAPEPISRTPANDAAE